MKLREQQKNQYQHNYHWRNTIDSTVIVLNSNEKHQTNIDRKKIQTSISQHTKDPEQIADANGGIIETNKPNQQFKQALIKSRMSKGLNQKTAAQLLQIQPNIYRDYESGAEVPNNQMIAKIERVFALTEKLPRNPKKRVD